MNYMGDAIEWLVDELLVMSYLHPFKFATHIQLITAFADFQSHIESVSSIKGLY